MKRQRSTQEQISFALRQAESGTPVDEICRKLGVTEIRRLHEFRAENGKLKKLVAT